MQFIVHPAADVGNVQSYTRLPSGQFQLASYSWPVTSSMIGPMEASGSGKVALLSIGGRKIVTLRQPRSKFPPLLTLLPSGPIVSRFIKEVMTSI